MNEEYLWDRSGPPDPEIEQLERTLAPLRYRHRTAGCDARRGRATARWLAAAAAVLVAAVAVWQIERPGPQATDWQVASSTATARMGRESASGLHAAARRAVAAHRTRIRAPVATPDELGQIDLGPESELRASSTSNALQSRQHARVHLGAARTVRGGYAVGARNRSRLRVHHHSRFQRQRPAEGALGWVAFQHARPESFIPGGAACVTRKRARPRHPVLSGRAGGASRSAITGFEKGEPGALAAILAAARPRDGRPCGTCWPESRTGSRRGVRPLRAARERSRPKSRAKARFASMRRRWTSAGTR